MIIASLFDVSCYFVKGSEFLWEIGLVFQRGGLTFGYKRIIEVIVTSRMSIIEVFFVAKFYFSLTFVIKTRLINWANYFQRSRKLLSLMLSLSVHVSEYLNDFWILRRQGVGTFEETLFLIIGCRQKYFGYKTDPFMIKFHWL